MVLSICEEVDDCPTITVLDIGARWATHITGRFSALHNSGNLRVIGIEPDSEECSRLQEKYPHYDFYSIALGSENKEGTLFKTKEGGRSSIYEPNREVIEKFTESTSEYDIVDEINIRLNKLDTLLKEEGIGQIDFIKSDTQGSEYDILQGGEQTIRKSVLGLELEAFHIPIYKQQGLFYEIDGFLQKLDFEFNDMRFVRLGRDYHWRRGDTSTYDQFADGQIIESDVLYFKQVDNINRDTLLKILLLNILYGKVSKADYLLEKEKQVLEKEEYKLISNIIGG